MLMVEMNIHKKSKKKATELSKKNLEQPHLVTCFIISVIMFLLFVLNKPVLVNPKDAKLKYVLIWEYSVSYSFYSFPFWHQGGQSLFIKRNCSIQDCYLTNDRTYFGDVSKFDAIIFDDYYIVHTNTFPIKRSPHQKYIFVALEPSVHTTHWRHHFKEFFNWTMTYKLNSDVIFPYLIIRDKNGNIVGPKEEMHWKYTKGFANSSLNKSFKTNLQYKSKAVAWFVSHCNSFGKREKVVDNLQLELINYGLTIDKYGECSQMQCPKSRDPECLEMISKDYYFYLSFENAVCEDYVTEKLLRALRHSAVPVVYGGANYTRFMPDGAYLDARKLNAAELAQQINELMQDRMKYYQFFKWRNFYSYHSSEERPDSDPYCILCAKLYNEDVLGSHKVYYDFIGWWKK